MLLLIEIEPGTWAWFVRHSYWMLGLGMVIGLVLGHINGFLHARGTVSKLFDEPERKPVQSATMARSARMSG